MSQQSILEKYFSPRQLKLAWERMIRSNGRDIKDYWGIEIYNVKLDENLKMLSDKIISGHFKPSRPFKYYEPKASGTHRTKTILPLEDAIVYQALANKIATDKYALLADNNGFVFGSVLHPEVEKGTDILDNEKAEYFFFEYYLPHYNKFVDSVNHEIENLNVRYKLETDITGFFDCIPHSKLLMVLHKYNVEPEILDFLENCLNLYSGTRDSITPGVGIPQGPAASFFFANIFLSELDARLNRLGYSYYRYMDDIRIYEEDEDQLYDALVLIDNYLKGNGLSLNSKKTSVEILEEDREKEKIQSLFSSYNDTADVYTDIIEAAKTDLSISDVADQGSDSEQTDAVYATLSDEELIAFCTKEVKEAETFFLKEFMKVDSSEFKTQFRKLNDTTKREIQHQTYKWRNANRILTDFDKAILNEKLIPIWLFLLENFFWKANHFCWNLNLYGDNKAIQEKLLDLQASCKLSRYEWTRYQIFSNFSSREVISLSQLKQLYRQALEEKSSLVRMGMYTVLLRFTDPSHQLFTSIKNAIKDESEPYIRHTLSGLMLKKQNFDIVKYWLGL
ncbi:RNA-directed DNA polymerase [Sphingobacterium sp. FBM7-1]|uniref:RNA-directed DNA polymerase n=1 Tax=Sphingobacterium sp. FBM7-1 TaxID=2886688 RepID=UPI001D0FF264|nr:RNA-directed DNA polymerase [Sphingobacterium sp. FBM7-1]MCC2598431.1 RNA-directed DNA polymerase [Sphingobacterium sp. FBM7-1]